MRKNNSLDENYFKQTNNRRSPYIACFPTSMINGAMTVGLTLPEPIPGSDESKYDQWEDRFDTFLHSDTVINHFADNAIVQSMIQDNYDYREIYTVEEWAFNKWMGAPRCKFIADISKYDIFNIINAGGALVTSGKFSHFNHVVCVVGYEAHDETHELEKIIFDDPYGDPRKNYKPVGVGGNDVEFSIDDFWNATMKSGGTHFGIVFLPVGSPGFKRKNLDHIYFK